MNRLFRNPQASRSGYVALALFAAAYLGAFALVFSPEALHVSRSAPGLQDQK